MSDHKNLSGPQAVKKMQELIRSENICLFTTRLDRIPLQARPMSTSQVDDQGNIWFISRKDSDKNQDISADSRVQLFYSNRGDSEFLSVYGEASLSTDSGKIDQLWSPLAKTWFPGGKTDPAVTLIRVRPLDAYYWDTRNGRIVSLVKIMAGALTGHESDDGIEGRIQP